MFEEIHALIEQGFLVDDILTKYQRTHKWYRQQCVKHDCPLPDPTQDLIEETRGYSRQDLIKIWKIPPNQANKILYGRLNLPAITRVTELRNQGATELEIYQVTGSTSYYNRARLSAELQELRDSGLKLESIAEMYGFSYSRVSQLTTSPQKPRITLSPEEKQAVIESKESAVDLAKKYGVAKNTIYTIKRRG